MKKALRIVAAVLVMASLMTLAGCSNFNKVKKTFEKNCYVLEENIEKVGATFYEKYMDKEKADELGIKIIVHGFYKEGDLLNWAVVLEFDCSKEKMKEYMDSETLKGFYQDLQKNDRVNGTCVLVWGDNDAIEVFKKA